MRYVNKKMVIVINKLAIEHSGGMALTETNLMDGKSLGFIEKIHTNQMFGQKLYPDIFHQAAAYMHSIIKNHTFHDGNKRTGLATAVTFLKWNNVAFSPFNEDKVFDKVISITESTAPPEEAVPDIAGWLKEMSLY